MIMRELGGKIVNDKFLPWHAFRLPGLYANRLYALHSSLVGWSK